MEGRNELDKIIIKFILVSSGIIWITVDLGVEIALSQIYTVLEGTDEGKVTNFYQNLQET